MPEARERLGETGKKEIACTAKKNEALEASSVHTKDPNGSKRVFNINFVAT